MPGNCPYYHDRLIHSYQGLYANMRSGLIAVHVMLGTRGCLKIHSYIFTQDSYQWIPTVHNTCYVMLGNYLIYTHVFVNIHLSLVLHECRPATMLDIMLEIQVTCFTQFSMASPDLYLLASAPFRDLIPYQGASSHNLILCLPLPRLGFQ